MVLKNSRINVGLESIAIQDDETFTRSLVQQFEEILDLADESKGAKFFMQKRIVKELFKELDLLLLKRFGIPIKHISGQGIGYAVTPIQPKGVNTLAGNITEKMDMLTEYLRINKPKCTKINCIEDLGSDHDAVIYQILESHRELVKIMNTTGVVINEEGARITGLTSAFKVLAIVDVPQLKGWGWNAEECVAALLHEVGHAFTHIAESYKSVRYTSSIVETIGEVKDKPSKQQFRIINKKVFGKPTDTNDSIQTLYIKLQNNLLEATRMNSNDKQVDVESERMADEFAQRFGMGVHLASALSKNYTGKTKDKYPVSTLVIISLRIITIVFILIGTGLLFILAAFMLGMAVYIGLTYAIFRILFTGEKSSSKVYDIDKQRLIRMRTEELKQLRQVDDKDFKELKKDNVRAIGRMIKDIPEQDMLGRIADFMPWSVNKSKETDTLRGFEEGIDNILYATHQDLEGLKDDLPNTER